MNKHRLTAKNDGCRVHKSRHRVKNKKNENKGWFDMLDILALILLVIGGLNWGSIGIFQFDLVAWLFGGQAAWLSRIVYTLVGLSALWCISFFFKDNDMLGKKDDM